MHAFNKRSRLPEYKGVPLYSFLCFGISVIFLPVIISVDLKIYKILLGLLSFSFFVAGLAVSTFKDRLLYWKLYIYGRKDRRRVNAEKRHRF